MTVHALKLTKGWAETPPYRRESASEIAARIRNAIPPRPVFVSEAQGNGETISWIGVSK